MQYSFLLTNVLTAQTSAAGLILELRPLRLPIV